MKKWLLVCLISAFLPAVLAECCCPVCGEDTADCLVDERGAVYCSGTLVSYPQEDRETQYAVREGTCIIGKWAFAGAQLEEVILPEGVVMIDTGALEGCLALQQVTLPDSLLIIGGSAFYNCPALSGVMLPPQLYAIGPSAFVENWQMREIVILESVRYIGSEVLCNTGLQEIWLHTCDFEWGREILTPGYQNDPPVMLTIHISMTVEEEVGTIANFCEKYGEKNITYRVDIPETMQ